VTTELVSLVAKALRDTPRHLASSAWVQALRPALNFRNLIEDLIASLAIEQYFHFNRPYMVSGVEPKVFVIHDDPAGFQLVLNHFDRAAFDRHRAAGRIRPHFHQCAFATRILRGGYVHVVYDNMGTLIEPLLSVRTLGPCHAGDLYTMAHHRYHCVLKPLDDTLTLMVRGARAMTLSGRCDASYSLAAFAVDWERARAALGAIPTAAEGNWQGAYD
jgi:hypothetical protein